MTVTLKTEYIGNNLIELSIDKIGVYEVSKSYPVDVDKGLWKTDRSRRTRDEKSAKNTYSYYKRLAKQEVNA